MDKIIESIKKEKIIAIVRGIAEDKLVEAVRALYKGGIRLVEVTFDQSGKIKNETTAKMISMLVENFDDMLIGAGTVITKENVELARSAGAKYIISPNTDEYIIKYTKDLGMVSIPGALTPTEILNAHNFGADFVKLFPASQLGAGYIKSIMAPLSHISILAVGGINDTNAAEFLNVGIRGIGVGGELVSNKLINEGKYDELAILAKKYADLCL